METTISSHAKFYNNNKDKILAYKKQYYQNKHKEEIILKHFKINVLSKRVSNNVLKYAFRNNLIVINIENDNANNDYDCHTYTFKEFIDKYDINGILSCEAGIFKDGGMDGELILSDTPYDSILEQLSPNSQGYKLHLVIYNQIKIKN